MPWRLEFQYTFDDLREANAAHARRRAGRAPLFLWAFFILLAVAFFLILQSHERGVGPRAPKRPPSSLVDLLDHYKVLVWAVLFVMSWVFISYWNKRQMLKRFDAEPTIHQVQRVDITNDGLTHSSLVSSTTYKWDAFVRHAESPNLFLLYLNDTTFDLIPKRAFRDAADADAFRDFLARTINPPRRAFPVLPPKP
jgi:hypothetical protein